MNLQILKNTINPRVRALNQCDLSNKQSQWMVNVIPSSKVYDYDHNLAYWYFTYYIYYPFIYVTFERNEAHLVCPHIIISYI